MPKIIVIISTYNGATNIERQLDSIFSQEKVEVSVLIRDDNSTDNTVDIIKKYILEHANFNIKLILGENIGYAKSFWLGLKNSDKADYYAFSDQDDVWKKDKLFKCIDMIREDKSIPQLSYCKMQRSDKQLNRLNEQVEILRKEKLTKKLTLIKTYNYGAATVINNSAKELVCRVWPDIDDLPHDMWIGTLCYWFGKVYYIDEELYYWIRYDTSVTGEGTKSTGIKYRLNKTLQRKSYPNICNYILKNYSDLLTENDSKFLKLVHNYKKNFLCKTKLLFDKNFKRTTICGTVALKLGILFNWY